MNKKKKGTNQTKKKKEGLNQTTYIVKVFDNDCCAERGGGEDGWYNVWVHAKDDNEVLAICALSVILDYRDSNRKHWLGDIEKLKKDYQALEKDFEEIDEELDLTLEEILANPLEALEEHNEDGLDGGWEAIYKVWKRGSKEEPIFEDENVSDSWDYE